MKRTQEIIGLPIISISDGIEVGKVKNIIINADKGAIDYIVVDSGIQILSARVIPTDNILGIGEYALTIESDSSINDISKIPAAIDLLQKNIQVKGTKVLTKKGRLIGEIGDIYVDEDDCCSIIGLEYIADITQKKIRLIQRNSVITFGKNLVVVEEDVENHLVDKPDQLGTGGKAPEGEKKNQVNSEQDNMYDGVIPDGDSVLKTDEFIASNAEAYYKQISSDTGKEKVQAAESTEATDPNAAINTEFFQPEQAVGEEAPTNGGGFPDGEYSGQYITEDSSGSSPDNSAAGLFEQKQRQYLNGRRVTKTITDNYGNVIVYEGTEINDEIIDEAKQKGKLIELVMNNKG